MGTKAQGSLQLARSVREVTSGAFKCAALGKEIPLLTSRVNG
jgi:hypothetical protein